MQVDETAPVGLTARVLQPPKLRYGQGSPQPIVVSLIAMLLLWDMCSQSTKTPRDGAWNMYDLMLWGIQVVSQSVRIDKRFYRPASIEHWMVVVYERQQRFGQQAASDMVSGLVQGCTEVGMSIGPKVLAFIRIFLQV